MKVRKEITVALQNRPGALGGLTAWLGKKKVNILAISVHESAEVGIVRMVVDKPSVAVKMISECCPMTLNVCDVLELRAPNRPGILGEIAAKLGRRKINIEYVYGSAAGGKKAAIILQASNLKKAAKALRGM